MRCQGWESGYGWLGYLGKALIALSWWAEVWERLEMQPWGVQDVPSMGDQPWEVQDV